MSKYTLKSGRTHTMTGGYVLARSLYKSQRSLWWKRNHLREQPHRLAQARFLKRYPALVKELT